MNAAVTDLAPILRVQGDLTSVAQTVARRVTRAEVTGIFTLPDEVIRLQTSTQARWLLEQLREVTSPTEGLGSEEFTELAELAARAGAPAESVSRFVREVHRAVWERLMDLAPPTEAGAVVNLVRPLWRAADELTEALEDRYHQVQSALRSRRKESLDQLALALLVSDGRDQTVAQRFCAYLDTTEMGSWLTAVGVTTTQRKMLTIEAQRLTMQGYPAHCLEFDSLPILIAQLNSSSRAIPNDWLRTPTCGYAIASSLSKVPEALRLARQVATTLPLSARGRWSTKDNWIRIASSELMIAREYIRAEVMASAHVLDDATLEQLLTVLRSYLRTGSVQNTAQECFLHRNTVLNRLRRIRDLTGLDATVPKDSALLVLTFGLAD